LSNNTFTIVFDQPVFNFTIDDLVFQPGATKAQLGEFAVISGDMYTVTVVNASAEGNYTLFFAADADVANEIGARLDPQSVAQLLVDIGA
jgi:hypothetical protein